MTIIRVPAQNPVNRPSLKQVLSLFNELEAADPLLMKTLYPRRYRHVRGYEDGPRAYATWMHSILTCVSEDSALDVNQTLIASYIVAEKLCARRVPTYFIAEDVLDLLMQTEPPTDMSFSELKMPVDGFLLVIPQTINKYMPPGIKLIAIACRTVPPYWAGEQSFLINGKPHRQFKSENEAPMFVLHAIVEEDGRVCDFNQQIRCDEPINLLLTTKCEYYQLAGETNEERDILIQRVILFATLHTLLLFNADPLCFEKPTLANPPVHRGDGKLLRHGVWHPNFIGRSYRKSSAQAGGTHASPAAHIRRSHWHTYWVGKGRTEKRVKWVLWTHVNLEKDQ